MPKRLKEFDLDAPRVKKRSRAQFRNETRCVTALFERCFGRQFTSPYWKIMVEGVGRVEDPRSRDLLGVLAVEVEFHFDKYFEANAETKKHMALDLLWSGIQMVTSQQNLSVAKFEAAYKKVIGLDLRNEWVWKKPKLSPMRDYRAEVVCLHDVDAFTATMRVTATEGQLVLEHVLFEETPDEFLFASNLGELQWKSNDTVALISKDGADLWECALK